MKYKVIRKWPGGPDVGTEGEIQDEEFTWDRKNYKSCDVTGINIEEYFAEVKELPKSWEECNPEEGRKLSKKGSAINLNESEIYSRPTDHLCLASKALAKLMQLRDVYRNGWKPNLDPDYIEETYGVFYDIMKQVSSLSFPTRELRNQFQDNFKDLIEQAKPLFYS